MGDQQEEREEATRKKGWVGRPERRIPVQRRTYSAPRLSPLGDIRSLTLGGSPGENDSGNPFIADPFTP